MIIPALVHPDVATSLALALVAASNAPIVLLDGELNVIAVSGSFCDVFSVAPSLAPSRPLAELGSGEWARPQLKTLLKAARDGPMEAGPYEMDLVRHGQPLRRIVVNIRKLTYVDQGDVRLLMTVADVTDSLLAAKIHKELMAEKDTLLHELQHRVANSLQIIASVLLQSARAVRSDETRQHLYDAHIRVMSVATLQTQLAVTGGNDVRLQPYFIDLCASIGASMIHDKSRIVLAVDVDDCVIAANTSISLGLLVTELVINSLKHAFPGDQKGQIKVDCHAHGPDWTLSVADNGAGMAKVPIGAKAGLGTSIVEAIARQLEAKVSVADGHPGTIVSVVHTHDAVGHRDALTAV